jgi:biotin carboxylase
MKLRTVCIVDGYSTGAELAPLFLEAGYMCVHVQSNPQTPHDFLTSFRGGDFSENIVFHAGTTWIEVLRRVAEHRPDFILPGTETGVPLADYLSTALSLPGNDAASSALRRDKFEMQEALRRAGLAAIAQVKASSSDEAVAWCARHAKWPVVVKPIDSAGADSVRFCDNENEVRQAVLAIIGHTNRLGIRNEGALLQERLLGNQYFVNAVSVNGTHIVTEIWADQKTEVPGATLICDKEELLPFHGEAQTLITDYLRRALTVLGVKNGPSHSELMLTSSGPVLIETAARMQGTILHEAVVAAVGSSHVTATVERFINPDTFGKRALEPYQMKAGLYCITLQSSEEGIVVENNCESHFATLPSYYAMFHTPQPGERIFQTTDLFSNPRIIYLLHESRDQLETDYRHIREWEAAAKLFSIETAR